MKLPKLCRLLTCAVLMCAIRCTPPGANPMQGYLPDGDEMDENVRETAMDAANEKFAELIELDDPAAAAQQMLAYLQSRPEFAGSGIRGVNVFGIFQDHIPMLFVNSRPPSDGKDWPPARWQLADKTKLRTGIPFSNSAYVANTLDESAFKPAAPKITSMLSETGYSVSGEPPTVEFLRQGPSNAAVFYIDAHGGVGPSFNDVEKFGVVTATPALPSTWPTYFPEVKADRLILGTLINGRAPSFPKGRADKIIISPHKQYRIETLYMFTDEFVKHSGMSFSEDSLVFLNTCDSYTKEAEQMRDAFFSRGAAAYMGWTDRVDDLVAWGAGPYFFDRILGANTSLPVFPPESPPQRPFSANEVLLEMSRRDPSLTHDGRPPPADLVLAYNPADNADFGLLAPSIRYVWVDAKNDELHLQGWFGYQQGQVLVGGFSPSIKSWGHGTLGIAWPDEIVCDLPRDAHGDVTVFVDGRKSNTVQLTQWELTLKAKQSLIDPNADGQIDLTVEAKIKFRACVNEFRDKPHTDPTHNPNSIPVGITRDSTGHVEATGFQHTPPNQFGNGEVTVTAKTPSDQDWVVVDNDITEVGGDGFGIESSNYVVVQPAQRGIKLHIEVAGHWDVAQDDDTNGHTEGTRNTGWASNTYFDTTQPIQLQLDGNYGIVAGMVSDRVGQGSTLEWKDAAADPPPSEDAAR